MPDNLIDISQPLSSAIAVWPGDTELQSQWVMRIADGASVNVGTVTMSLHTGSHADAPLHVTDGAVGIADCPLAAYIGEAFVIDATDSSVVQERHVSAALAQGAKRLLLKTNSATNERFADDFSYFSQEAARATANAGALLAGIDTPSVDRFDSKTLDSHHIFCDARVAILENLALKHVEPGRYELMAAPLKIVGMDASPVRAVLRRL